LYPVSEEDEDMLLFRKGTFEKIDAKVIVNNKAIQEDLKGEREDGKLTRNNNSVSITYLNDNNVENNEHIQAIRRSPKALKPAGGFKILQ
jgi:hypothetical protein